MVNAPKKHFSSPPDGIYGKLPKMSPSPHHQANKGKSGLVPENVPALEALHILRSKKKLAEEKRLEVIFLSNEAKEKSIEDYVERETALARWGVQDAGTAIMQDMTTAANRGATTGKLKTTIKEMLNAIGVGLSNLASSDDVQNGEDEAGDEEDTEPSKLSDHDEPGRVMGTITKMVQHHMETFWQKEMRLHELTQPGWWDVANYIHERDWTYGTAELKLPAVVKPQTHTTAATSSPRTVGLHMQPLLIVRGHSGMPAVTSRH